MYEGLYPELKVAIGLQTGKALNADTRALNATARRMDRRFAGEAMQRRS